MNWTPEEHKKIQIMAHQKAEERKQAGLLPDDIRDWLDAEIVFAYHKKKGRDA